MSPGTSASPLLGDEEQEDGDASVEDEFDVVGEDALVHRVALLVVAANDAKDVALLFVTGELLRDLSFAESVAMNGQV